MRLIALTMPDGWPASLWLFAVTAILFLLQRIPFTGIFLMIVGAAFWSILLINAGMAGIAWEAFTGRVNVLWLIVPALYVGGYYLAYANDLRQFARVASDTEQFNTGKSLAFDHKRQDLLIEIPGDGLGLTNPAAFIERYALDRVFASDGRMFMVAAQQTCTLLRDNPMFKSALIQTYSITSRGRSAVKRNSTGFCIVIMPGKPEKPVLRVTDKEIAPKYGRLPVRLREIVARDTASGLTATVRAGHAAPLKRFPLPVMGCALNSGRASWECFAGFLRNSFTRVLPASLNGPHEFAVVAQILGLMESSDLSARAIGPERFQPIVERAEKNLVATQIALLETLLADPTAPIRDVSFRHLQNKPELVGLYAARIVETLGRLQNGDHRGSSVGTKLWDLVAALPDASLAPHRAQVLAWLHPQNARSWTKASTRIYQRLDATRPEEREILLQRMEAERNSLHLAGSFCRMGAAAPDDAKRRLLALWHSVGTTMNRDERPPEHLPLYLALARMGLKSEAGKVEQRYYGPTFAGIWDEITPDTPADICELSENDLTNRFRRR